MSQINYKSKYLKYKAKYLFITNNQMDQELRSSLNQFKGGASDSVEKQITIDEFILMIEDRKNPIYTKIDEIQKEIDGNNIIISNLESKLKETKNVNKKLQEDKDQETRKIEKINTNIDTTSYEEYPMYGKLKEKTKLIDEKTINLSSDLDKLTLSIMQKTTDKNSGKYYYSYK